MAVLVDSSLWVHQLRKSGDPAKRDRVNALLESGEAAWCPAVRLELWRGVTNDAERKTLRRYEALLPDYEISAEVWDRAIRLADRGAGIRCDRSPCGSAHLRVCEDPRSRGRARRHAFRRVGETRGVMARVIHWLEEHHIPASRPSWWSSLSLRASSRCVRRHGWIPSTPSGPNSRRLPVPGDMTRA